MPVDTFKLPQPDVRLVMLEDTVYKIKLNMRKNRQNSSHGRDNQGLLCANKKNQEDIEKTVTAVLAMELLQPIETTNLIIYPYRKKWETGEKLVFSQNSKRLKAHPYTYSFYIEEKLDASSADDMTDDFATHMDHTTSSRKRQEGDTNTQDCITTSIASTCKQQHTSEETCDHPVWRNLRAKTVAQRKRKYHDASECEQKDFPAKQDSELNEHSCLHGSAMTADKDASIEGQGESSKSSSALQAAVRLIVTPVKRLFEVSFG